MELPVINSKSKSLKVPDSLFNQDINDNLINQLINSYIDNGHQGTKAQKNRSQVSGGGKKPWRQKGTGRARAGTSRSPIWRGGGVTFAARSKSSNPKKINKKMYKVAMKSILSSLAKTNKIFISQGLEVGSPKTTEMAGLLKKIGFDKGLLIFKELNENLILSSRNIPNIEVTEINSLNPVSLLKHKAILISDDCFKELEELYS
ncbi:MAG: 50S ribosomal protein L4 [Gammaproteobacteria bacterium]|nr:MAG: 50S ribosomal protein L4 [Gammaproteobacteria bacterium]